MSTEGSKKLKGRPPKYSNPEDLQKKIDEYFIKGRKTRQVVVGKGDDQKVIEIPIITICGLVRYCGFASRQSFYDIEKNLNFSYTIKKARMRIEEEYEELLQRGLGAGAIFALKNFDWQDKTEIEHSGEIKIMETIKIDNKKLEPRVGAGNRLPSMN